MTRKLSFLSKGRLKKHTNREKQQQQKTTQIILFIQCNYSF